MNARHLLSARVAADNAHSDCLIEAPQATDLCQREGLEHVGEVRLGHSAPTEADWNAIEAEAVRCMRDCLLRLHQDGNFIHSADYTRSRHAWEMVVINREGAKP